AWKRAIMPQPTMQKPSMAYSSRERTTDTNNTHLLRWCGDILFGFDAQKRGSTPEILQTAQRGGANHGVDEPIADHAEIRGGFIGPVRRFLPEEDRKQGCPWKHHFYLAQPVGTEEGAAVLQKAPQSGDDEFACDNHRDHPRQQPWTARIGTTGPQQKNVSTANQHLVYERI